MAAYAAVNSLKHTIQYYLVNHSDSPISVASSSREIIEFIDEELTSIQQVLKRLDESNKRSSRRIVESLDAQIRDAVHKLDCAIDSCVYNQVHNSPPEEKEISVSFENVREELSSLTQELKQMKELYIEELENPKEEEEDEDDSSSSSVDFDRKKPIIVFGLSGKGQSEIKSQVIERTPYEFGVVSIIGKEGTGSTIFAKEAFGYTRSANYYDTRAWVSVGPKYEVKEIIISLLSQIDSDFCDNYKLELISDGEKWLGEQLNSKLKGRRYLIALHNVCDTLVWDCLRRLFPAENNGSRVLLTTSLEEVAAFVNGFKTYRLDFLNEEESWNRIRQGVFGECWCPPELEEVGKKIAKNCGGLPVELVKVVLLLCEADMTPECWDKIAADQKQICVSVDAYDEVSEIYQIAENLQWGHNFGCNDRNASPTSKHRAKVIARVLGLRSNIIRIKHNLFFTLHPEPKIVSLVGMAGIGKTTLAKEIFEDPLTLSRFDHRVWVTLGPKYRYGRILVDILTHVDPSIDMTDMEEDEISFEHFSTILSGKKCLFVLDNVWDQKPLRYLDKLFKYIKFEVLLTTRLEEVAANAKYPNLHEMRLLNNEESWYLFCEKIFGKKSCPAELEKPGRMIVENCEGLPLMIVTIAGLLSLAEKTLEFWNKVARKQNSVFKDAYDKIYNTLLPSYEYLPQHLKPCFLYMGVFLPKYEIPTSKLFELWSSEGILESLGYWQYLEELVSNRILLTQNKNYSFEDVTDFQMLNAFSSRPPPNPKTCRLHSVFWHLCIRIARNLKFFLVLNTIADSSPEDINGQRRLCVHNNILFAIKDVYTSIASDSTSCSLLCTGPYHPYPVPVCLSLTLLKILDALSVCFYEFPCGVFELVLLRYLALTCNKILPTSISRLRNLQYLIIGGHMSTKLLHEAPLYMPKEIWDMKQLKHLQVMGSDLPDPCGVVLPNLLILLDVSPHSCTEGVFRGTPNLQKLGIRIEPAPNEFESSFCFDHISILDRLESLKCVVVNPVIRYEVVPPPAPITMFLSRLTKLSLSGLRYPWEYMGIIGKLRFLQVLKLRCYAFQGAEWVMDVDDFKSLSYMVLEDTDLVCWRAADSNCGFQCLQHLIIRHCYKLQEISTVIQNCGFYLSKVEIVDCHPSASTQISESALWSHVSVHSSWE